MSAVQVAPAFLPRQPYLEEVGVWPDFHRGAARQVRIEGTRALVGSEFRGFHLVDFQDPRQPIRLASTPTERSVNGGFWWTRDILFISTGGSSEAYDLSVPNAPFLIKPWSSGSISPLARLADYPLAGGFANQQLVVLDLSDPLLPSVVARSEKFDPKVLTTMGNLMVTATAGAFNAWSRLVLYQYTAPDQLRKRGELTLGTGQNQVISDLHIHKDRVYARVDSFSLFSPTTSWVDVVNIVNPDAPARMGSFPVRGYAPFAILDSTALVTDANDGLGLFNVEAADHAAEISRVPTRHRSVDVALQGNLALVADSDAGLQILDVSEPAKPRRVSEVDLGGFASDVLHYTNATYVADGGAGLRVFDNSIATNLVLMNRLHLGGEVTALQRSGSRLSAIVVPSSTYSEPATNSAIQWLDLENPFFPRRRGRLEWPLVIQGQRALGNRTYLAAGTTGVLVIDTGDLDHPVEIGRQDTFGEARDIDVSADRAYVADGSQGVQIYDVSDPTHFRRLGGYRTQLPATHVLLAANHLFVTQTNYSRVEIVDISDPSAPRMISFLQGLESPLGVRVAGDLALVGESSGLGLHNIAQIDAPKSLQATHFTSEDKASVADVNGRTVTLAMGVSGLRVFQLTGRTEQRLHLDVPSPVALGRGPVPILATASSGLPVTVSVVDGPAHVTDGKLVATNYGPVTLRADQPGNDAYFGTSLELTVEVRVPIRLAQSRGAMDLYWPAVATGLRLQRTPALEPEAHWEFLDAPVDVVGEEFHLRVPTPATGALFRLNRAP